MHKDYMDDVFRDFMKEKYGGIDVLVNNAAVAFKQVKYYFLFLNHKNIFLIFALLIIQILVYRVSQ